MGSVLVVGGSLGGLMAANVLLRAGHRVTVLERSTRSLQGRGAGIVTHESLRTALRAAGVTVDAQLGIQVEQRVVLDAQGGTSCQWAYPQLLTSWGRLYALLLAALPAPNYRLAASVSGVSQTADQVSALLHTGEILRADLLIACDGIRSTVRMQLAPDVQPQYAGYVAWRGVCEESALSQHTRKTLFNHFGFGLPDAEQLIGYPVAGTADSTQVGQRRWNFVWYRPAAAGAELAALMTDADGVHHPDGIAPQQVSWRTIAAMREAARQTLAPQFAEVLEKTAVPFLQPIFDLASPQLAFGRVALLGDAAFVARPHVGMGVTKAADDAMALVASLAAHGATAQALGQYAHLRGPAGAAVVARARVLGASLQSGQTQQRSAEAVMKQTAIDPAHFESLALAAQAACDTQRFHPNAATTL
jgi:2-polyprenyl-6-methoxyphenol hydroxylase-like FAD-dependent oxidoreductase